MLSSMAECVNAHPVQEKNLTGCIPHFSISFPSLDCVCLSTSECGVWRGRSGCVRLFSRTGTRGPSDQASLGIISLFPGLPLSFSLCSNRNGKVWGRPENELCLHEVIKTFSRKWRVDIYPCSQALSSKKVREVKILRRRGENLGTRHYYT